MIKKFFVALILGLIEMSSQIVYAENYDIPSFRKIAGRNVTFTGHLTYDGVNSSSFGYKCSMDLEQDFAKQYVQAILNSRNFILTDHRFDDYRKHSSINQTFEHWYFTYVGSKKDVPTFSVANLDHPGDNYLRYKAHLSLIEQKNYIQGTVEFKVSYSRRLTWAGKDEELYN